MLDNLFAVLKVKEGDQTVIHLLFYKLYTLLIPNFWTRVFYLENYIFFII
jgi:hypothetical protein